MNDERRLRSVPIKADPVVLSQLRVACDDALHTYIVAATGYDLPRAMVIFNRVRITLTNQLAPVDGPTRGHVLGNRPDGNDAA